MVRQFGASPFALLLQQIVGELPSQPSAMDEATPGEEIVVSAPQSHPEASVPDYEEAPERPKIQPRYVLGDDRIAPSREELKEIVPRQGMFGLKGTLRDVLGAIGDAFLVQGDGEAVYGPQRLKERQGDAMFGASQDPMQAAERLAAMGDVEGARQLLGQAQQNDYRQGSLASMEGSRQAQEQNRIRDDLRYAQNKIARWLYTAGDNPARIEYVMQLAQAEADRLGVPLTELGFPDSVGLLSEDQREVLSGGDMTVNQQIQVPYTERRVRAAEQNADTARISASRPRSGPAARQPTSASIAAPLLDKLQRGGTLTTSEREVLDRTGYGPGKGRGARRAPPPSSAVPTKPASRFRILD